MVRPSTVIVRLKGGLGNQMFQYAYGRNLALKQKAVLELDRSFLRRRFWQKMIGVTPRGYELEEFNIKAGFAKPDFRPRREGYWQNEKYFKKIRPFLLREFTLKKESEDFLKLKKLVRNSSSVSIHFRRGDYVASLATNKYHGVLNLDYYMKAIKVINKRVKNSHFFVFSDDVEWVKKNFSIRKQITYISGDYALTNIEEMLLMSMCKHNIVANSSFSWWGAWLNKNPRKIVVAPKRWFMVKTDLQTIPRSWIKL